MNINQVKNNIKNLNKIYYGSGNVNQKSGEYNYISPVNYYYIMLQLLDNYKNNGEYLSGKMMKEIAGKHDTASLNKYGIDINKKITLDSKEFQYDNILSYDMEHHNEILLEEIYFFDDSLNNILGFKAELYRQLIKILDEKQKRNISFISESELKENIELYKLIDTFSIKIEEVDFTNDYLFEDYPFVKVKNTYICTQYEYFKVHYRRLLDFRLKNNEYYKKKKGETFEKSILKILNHFNKGQYKIYNNLTYQGNECDFIIEDDTRIIIIEAKSKYVYDLYKRNDESKPNAIANNIADIEKSTYDQCTKMESAIKNSKDIYFEGEKIMFSTEKEIMKIGVSVETHYGYDNPNFLKYIALSYSEFMSLFEIIYEMKFNIENFNNIIDAFIELGKSDFEKNNIKRFIALHTQTSEIIDIFKLLSKDGKGYGNIGLLSLIQYDQFCMTELKSSCPQKKNLKNRYIGNYSELYEERSINTRRV